MYKFYRFVFNDPWQTISRGIMELECGNSQFQFHLIKNLPIIIPTTIIRSVPIIEIDGRFLVPPRILVIRIYFVPALD